MQACLRHKAQQPRGLQGHGLAAGIRSRHHQRPVALPDGDVDRHDLLRIDQRVRGLTKFQNALF